MAWGKLLDLINHIFEQVTSTMVTSSTIQRSFGWEEENLKKPDTAYWLLYICLCTHNKVVLN